MLTARSVSLFVAALAATAVACAPVEFEEEEAATESSLNSYGTPSDPLTRVPKSCKNGQNIYVRRCVSGPKGPAHRTCRAMCQGDGEIVQIPGSCGAFVYPDPEDAKDCIEENGAKSTSPKRVDPRTPSNPYTSVPKDCKSGDYFYMRTCVEGPMGPAHRTCRFMCTGPNDAVRDPSSCGDFVYPEDPADAKRNCY